MSITMIQFDGDVSGTFGNITVNKIKNLNLPAGTPTNGRVMVSTALHGRM
ncbi:MAG: hypothetical protein IPO65_21040 [Saprospiraceae bacterium]|nr:hypothetical protein [Saprospiraceae bacterium]